MSRNRKNRKQPDPGVLVRLEATSVYKPTRPDKVRGFYRGVKARSKFEFVPLGSRRHGL
jgi:hypothetical protein